MGYELFLNESQNKIVVHDKKTDEFRNFSDAETEFIYKAIIKIRDDYPKAYEALNKMYLLRANKRYMIVSHFFRCNFGMLDNILDIDDDFNFRLEKVFCPMRAGFCHHENVICNPELSTELSSRELEVAKLLAQELTCEEIGERLFISPFTAENHKKKIFAKLEIHTLASLVNYAYKNKLV